MSMGMKRLIIEFGQGVDMHEGCDTPLLHGRNIRDI